MTLSIARIIVFAIHKNFDIISPYDRCFNHIFVAFKKLFLQLILIFTLCWHWWVSNQVLMWHWLALFVTVMWHFNVISLNARYLSCDQFIIISIINNGYKSHNLLHCYWIQFYPPCSNFLKISCVKLEMRLIVWRK